jgi:hypothetical protein
MVRIVPRYKLLLRFNISSAAHEDYYQFVIKELVPGMQKLGLYMFRAYHTAYGPHPLRQLEFLAEDIDTVRKALSSEDWANLEGRLKEYVSDYSRKLIVYRDRFQL